MKIESRNLFQGEHRGLVLVAENEEESKLIDEFLGQPNTLLCGKVKLADGYGEHYLWVEQLSETDILERARLIIDTERQIVFASQYMGNNK